MCGIAGFIDSQPHSPEAATVLRRMLDRLSHRGPDAEGQFVADRVVIGHRRLSIVDLSPFGDQPMSSSSGRFVIAFNGEIYNHLELRKELESQGVAFRGRSDTEVLLACIERHGLHGALTRCVGMFAIVLWDTKERRLQLARDRFGEKPLYYGWHRGCFIFGSELKALSAHPAFDKHINQEAVGLLLHYGFIPAPHCIFSETWKLPQATILTLRLPNRTASLSDRTRYQEEITTYWSPLGAALEGKQRSFKGTLRDATDRLEALLADAVQLQMQADVPLGAFLSGGTDSSTIVALMARQSTRRIQTFAVGFGVDRFNEAPYAKAVAKHLGTDHTEIYVSPRDMLEVLPDLPRIYDEPLGDSSQIPTYIVARLARQSVTVCLTGDGGDEMFGGYPRYRLGARLSSLPQRRLLARLAQVAPHSVAYALAWPLLSRARARTGHAAVARYLTVLAANMADHSLVERLAHQNSVPAKLRPLLSHAAGAEYKGGPSQLTYLSAAMLRDQTTYLPDDILVKTDRACMAVSLENRAPMLDHRVAEFAATLPAHYLLGSATDKLVLRKVLYRYVPQQLVARPKAGFTIPMTDWFRTELREPLTQLVQGDLAESEFGFDRAALADILEAHIDGRADWSDLLWTIWSLMQWRAHLMQ